MYVIDDTVSCVHPISFYKNQITSEEKRALERMQYASLYDKARKAAEVHRQVRRHAQSYIKPGIKLIDMCTMLEEKVGGVNV